MKMEHQFYITLPSNVKPEAGFSYNTIASYNTKLFKKLEFPRNEKWCVGLVGISYTKSWYNVRLSHQIRLFDKYGELYEMSPQPSSDIIPVVSVEVNPSDITEEYNITDLIIKQGFYESVQSLCAYINKKLEAFNKLLKQIPLLKFDRVSGKVTLKSGEDDRNSYFPYLGDEVERILGLCDDDNISLYRRATDMNNAELTGSTIYEHAKIVYEIFSDKKYQGRRCAELNAGCHSLFIYSNIVEHSFVGDSFAQLLRISEVPNNYKFGEQVELNYDQPHYIPLQTTSFDTIQVDVKDDTGDNIPFEFGRVIVKLKFKKYA